MAFEDGYTLGMVLSSVSDKFPLKQALHIWEHLREERIRQMLELTVQGAKMRGL